MALWKDPTKDPSMPGSEGATALAPEPAVRSVPNPTPAPAAPAAEPVRPAQRAASTVGTAKESLIAADVTIEGKIEGAGHVRIAGRFKGDVNVQGNVTIEQGAHVTGQIAAATVMVSGEINGNVVATSRVELLETGIINGDVKAAVLTVAAGSRMRGNADFGWPESAK
jgi:cytoskeletal protein CcmA (bactofilin family)